MSAANGVLNGDAAMLLGHTFQMTATARFLNGGQDITKIASWDSSNPVVGTISADGVLTAHALGVTVITATYQGQSGSLPVTVAEAP
jgi:hypothetical protein